MPSSGFTFSLQYLTDPVDITEKKGLTMSDQQTPKHNIRRLLVGLSLAFMSSHIATATTAVMANSITIGVEKFNNLPFYSMCDRDYCGFARELFDRFAKDTGNTVKYRSLAIIRLHRALMTGEVDYKFPANPTFQVDLKVGTDIHYSDPVVDFMDAVLTLGDGPETITTLGLIRGFTFDKDGFEKNGPVRVQYAKDDVQLLEMLISKEVDAVFTNVLGFKFRMSDSGASADALKVRKDLPLFAASFHLSSMDKSKINTFNEWLAANKGYVDSLKQQHGLILDK